MGRLGMANLLNFYLIWRIPGVSGQHGNSTKSIHSGTTAVEWSDCSRERANIVWPTPTPKDVMVGSLGSGHWTVEEEHVTGHLYQTSANTY
ncbi:hypothetical protein B0T20DRAFT_63332 [Sordaria brevicollis]|uniref:Secreted protein n=1 Tax=Sordaria brevicollis TaxID=83679 RepID=A0AAE0U5I7_SORBR|nr:hypothetical protein B0T20DRAFT_63332 [Sordaria brevicollis]